MKIRSFVVSLAVVFGCINLSACGTLGGAVSGAGEDLQRAGQWIKSN